MAEFTQYDLSRSFWDFAFANPDLIKPTHVAIYFFAVEHCNRLGWKDKFGLPTAMVIEAVGLKSYNSYKKYFDELASWGMFKVIEYSKNQYSSNIIALSNAFSKNNKALGKALAKHTSKHLQSTSESTGSIDKPITINQEPTTTSDEIVGDNFPNPYGNLIAMKQDFMSDSFAVGMVYQKGVPHERIEGWLDAFNRRLIFTKDTTKPVQEYRSHFANWLVKVPNYKTTNPLDYEPINDPEIKQDTQYTLTPTEKALLEKYGTKH